MIELKLKNESKMPSKNILFAEFVDYFLDNDTQKSKQYEEHKEGDEEFVVVEYKSNDVDDLPCMCNMLWRVADEKWKKTRYNGSSHFAMWWYSIEEDDYED